MLSPGQAAHVLALYLAPRPLNADELRWLTGEAARPGDAARKQDLDALERLRMAERVPGGMPCWRAGPAAGAFVRARLFAGLWPPEHRAGALLSLLDEGAGPRRCADILRGGWTGGHADVELVPLLEVLVAFLMRWCARRAADPAALDGDFLNLLFALQGFPLSSLSLLRKILRLTARAYHMARNSGNERFMAMLLLSRLYLHVFVGNNSSRLADRLEAALNTVKAFLGPEEDSLLPLFEGQLAYMRGDLKEIIACFNRCPEDMAWCHRRFYDTLGVCALFSAGYLHQFHFALGSVEHFQRKAVLAGDELTAAMFRSNSCFLLLRKGDRQRMRAVLRGLEASPLYAEHAIVHSHVTRAHALLLFMEGDARGAHTLLDVRTRHLLARGDKPVTFKDPLVLDMLYVFSRNGWPAIPGYEADPLLRSFLQGANRHLKGTAMRIRALQLLDAAGLPRDAVALLRQSLDIFRVLGDPHALTLTVHALARARERDGDAGEARLLHDMVREATGRDLRGVEYHEACRACMEVRPAAFELFGAAFSEAGMAGKSVFGRCHAIFSALDMPDTREEALQHFVRAAMDAFRQERGGLFRPGEGGEPRFAHIANVSALELRSPAMRPCLDWLAEAARRSRRSLLRHERHGLVLRLAESDGRPWLLWMSSLYTAGPPSETVPAEELLRGGRLLAAELRAILRLEAFREREIAQQHDKLRTIFLREDRDDCLVLREGLHDLLLQAASGAVTDVPILICGETGTGKELMARHIHTASGRPGPFIPVHPAGMVESLFESEFFGHERGAFTGALKQKIGLFEMADQGTLFIDEIGEMSPLVQTKLLRVLQERRFMRVGGTRELHSRFRLIAATNRDLWQEVRERRFRQDLLYRIAVFPLTLPPLRRRKQDILPLTNAFIRHFARRYGKTVPPLSETQAGELLAYAWPGNIRELRSLVERAVILHRGGGLPLLFGLHGGPATAAGGKEGGQAEPPLPEGPVAPENLPTLEEAEALYLRRVMRLAKGRVRGEGGAAALLRMKIPTLYAKLRRHGIACGRDGMGAGYR